MFHSCGIDLARTMSGGRRTPPLLPSPPGGERKEKDWSFLVNREGGKIIPGNFSSPFLSLPHKRFRAANKRADSGSFLWQQG